MKKLDYSVMIVGAGPAGVSTWLHLQKGSPALARDAILIEREFLPREKLCGGGLTLRGERVLAHLGLHIDVPSILIQKVEFRYQSRSICFRQEKGCFRIIHRYEFDHALAKAARERGLQLREGESLLDYHCADDAVEVRTTCGSYRVGVLVGADGANSLVRAKLLRNREPSVSRLLEVVQKDPDSQDARPTNSVVFDFSYLDQEVQGYVWDFPCLRSGTVCGSYGIFDSRVNRTHQLASLNQVFVDALQERGAAVDKKLWKSHPIRWFSSSGCYSAARVLLVGDAAGSDPFLGEGISFALQYGEVAAQELLQAFQLEDFSLRNYRQHLLGHPLGRGLSLRFRLAKIFYARWPPALIRAGFSLFKKAK